MINRNLSEYFIGAAVKVLRNTEVNPLVSRGHELQGIGAFRKFLGDSANKDILPITYVWLSDEEEPVSLPLTGTWYDSRRNQPHRRPEYRFYYPAEAEEVVYQAKAGDTLVLCQPRTGPLLALFLAKGSSVERQILWLFDLAEPTGDGLFEIDLRSGARELDIIARYVLELLGVEVPAAEESLLEKLLSTFGNTFPSTRLFSQFTRDHAEGVDGLAEPDAALLAWMDLEERLFKTLESHMVGQRLIAGFTIDGSPDVDGFVKYSLGIQNRRKSRAGWAFANHIEVILNLHGLRFTREATTEKRAGPDFLFPSEQEYRQAVQNDDALTMLAAKTSCKDRWRQVLSEADKIHAKHLITLEPSISVTQTREMEKEKLCLVVPFPIHKTYLPEQRPKILSFWDFITLAKKRQ